MELSQKPQQEIMLRLVSTTDPGIVADALGQYATFGYEEKMQILKQLHPVKRLELANRLLAKELEVLGIESELNERAQESINKGQKDYYLREQLKVIRSGSWARRTRTTSWTNTGRRSKALELSEDTKRKAPEGGLPASQAAPGFFRGGGHPELSGYLPRLAVEHPDEGTGQMSKQPGSGWMRIIMAWKRSRSGFWNPWQCGSCRRSADGDPLPGGPPRRRQDLHRLQHRPVPEPEAGAHRLGRCPR